MTGRSWLIALIGIVAGLTAGFLVANTINRGEMDKLRAENNNLRSRIAESSKVSLTADEISVKIAEADANPTNFDFQRSLGTALYRYASVREDVDLLEKSESLLERASSLRPGDRELIIALANANFDLGYFQKNNNRVEKARSLYARVLEADSRNARVRTDYALTFFLEQPPDLVKTEEELRASLAADAGNEKTLEYLVQVLAKQDKGEEAQEFLEKLRAVNPSNQSLTGLTSLLAPGSQETVK
ncbi:MAG: hypothetical protein LC730_06340 [Acidobacteria bacterium]|nr:hypothetical protein [Acidobacteriota bacterium]MCA1609057.1 hypothetical protein [Acidobacteriota bacterium]